jgi:hypothetical protein
LGYRRDCHEEPKRDEGAGKRPDRLPVPHRAPL